jgi:hypothetical protein
MFRFAQRICVFTLAAAGVFAQAITAPAEVIHTTGIIGLAEGQIARLNVLNPGVNPGVNPGGVLAPAVGVICPAMLAFLDGTGKVLKSTSVSVTPGQSALFDLFSDADLNLALDARTEIRAVITIPGVVAAGSVTAQPAACTLIGTLEIFDSLTRRTQAVLGGTHDVPAGPATSPTPQN